jgi:hypothetical protein
MKAVFARRIGVILLQAVLTFFIIFSLDDLYDMPIATAVFLILVIGELMVILSNLKMRYWFPLLPYYFILGVSTWIHFLLDYYPELFMFLIVFPLACQIIIMIIVSIVERTPKSDKSLLRTIYAACFAEDSKTHKNIFTPPKEAYLPIFIQFVITLIAHIYSYNIYLLNHFDHFFYLKEYFFALLFVLSLIPIFLKINLRYWVLSIGVSGLVTAFLYYYDIYIYSYQELFFLGICFAQLLVISAYFILRFFVYFIKIRIRIRKTINASKVVTQI